MTRRIRKDPNIEIRTRGPQILHPPRTSRRRAGGGGARITRITSRLRLDVTLQIPFTYQLPAETTQLETLQVRNHTVIHQSFDDQEKAEQWAINFINRLKPCRHLKGREQ